MPSRSANRDLYQMLEEIQSQSLLQTSVPVENAALVIAYLIEIFRRTLLLAEYPDRKVQALITKFRDAGRRSAPWRPTSSRVPGRPQDGSDGNRINRWLLPSEHKFYADQVNATLVEAKYFLQTLSMNGAPTLPANTIQTSFVWLLGHEVKPGEYRDPIQLVPISFEAFIDDPRYVQSGHLTPLDRGGRHIPNNTFLMLARSNQIQGNQTLEELIAIMNEIVLRHAELKSQGADLPAPTERD